MMTVTIHDVVVVVVVGFDIFILNPLHGFLCFVCSLFAFDFFLCLFMCCVNAKLVLGFDRRSRRKERFFSFLLNSSSSFFVCSY